MSIRIGGEQKSAFKRTKCPLEVETSKNQPKRKMSVTIALGREGQAVPPASSNIPSLCDHESGLRERCNEFVKPIEAFQLIRPSHTVSSLWMMAAREARAAFSPAAIVAADSLNEIDPLSRQGLMTTSASCISS